ncbi:hypothetical protein DPM33_17790 [Mesorhizobium hawassense]|uniref:DUF4917 domain-containing protein n=1 Tax=Mesorhizobium hawassense TaxID=1209954 RepID=A0A330HL83_9HYPH|nr:DUF4917 family protein [Mesorhizobium hawassense]RAZ89431.1 hypothetical protein DPM33_17790 [Mesorhizobium hawassense]
MPDVIDFNDAMKRTEGEDRALLIGNGFSAQYFSYRNLLDKSGLAAGTPVRDLFDALGTVDFEAVVRALEGAVLVERAYGNAAHAADIQADAQKVREALVEAVNATHPNHREDLGSKYTSSADFLSCFSTVFSLNYDLLLYWVNLEKRLLRDGFGLGRSAGSFHGPFSEDAYCHLYNLHGGLHLFESGGGEIMKAVDTGSGVIATITDEIAKRGRFPVYVAEGTSNQKMRKINSVAYLRHCLDMLRGNSAVMFVYGHSADENDAHIYRAIFASEAKHIYFGVYNPDGDKLRALDGLLAKYQKTAGSTIGYTFFDSASAKVWAT